MPGPGKSDIPCSRPSLGEGELAGVRRVFSSRWLGMGEVVEEFEKAVAGYLGAHNVVAVNTGTSALHISLDAIGIRGGDDVILPSLTFVATVQAVLACGARPVFSDVDSGTLTISLEDVRKKISRRTKAVIPVHFGGTPSRMDELLHLGRRKKIFIVEDAAHAFGSTYHGKKIGSFGDITCFSFDPIKNITCGEGGAIATPHDAIANTIRKKRVLGIDKPAWMRQRRRTWAYRVTTSGFRYHMSNINAAIGLAQLRRVDGFIRKRKRICRMYDSALRGIGGLDLIERDYKECAPFIYILRVHRQRDKLISHLHRAGIEAGVHYIPNHIQPLFRRAKIPLPVTDRLWREILTLPLYSDMTDTHVDRVVKAVTGFFRG